MCVCVCVCVYVCGRARANTRGKRRFVVASSTHALRESDLVKMLKRKTKASTLRHRLPRLLLRHCQRQTLEKKPCWAQQKASVRMSERVTRAQLARSSSRLTFLSVASIQNFHCVAMETFHSQPQASRRPAPSRHSAHWTHLRAGMLTGETALLLGTCGRLQTSIFGLREELASRVCCVTRVGLGVCGLGCAFSSGSTSQNPIFSALFDYSDTRGRWASRGRWDAF